MAILPQKRSAMTIQAYEDFLREIGFTGRRGRAFHHQQTDKRWTMKICRTLATAISPYLFKKSRFCIDAANARWAVCMTPFYGNRCELQKRTGGNQIKGYTLHVVNR